MLKRVYLDRNDLELWVGPLEKAILCCLWEIGKPTGINDLHRFMLAHDYNLAQPTVLTTLQRMTRKELLTVNHTGRKGFWYPYAENEDAFIQLAIGHTIRILQREYPHYMKEHITL